MTQIPKLHSRAEVVVPVIDIGQLENTETQAAIDAACQKSGIFQVVNHGIAAASFAKLLDEQRRFFALPSSQKRRIERTGENPWGFFDQELTKNTPDWKEIFDVGRVHGLEQPQWPSHRDEFQPSVTAAFNAMQTLARRLLAVIASNLGATPGELEDSFVDHTSFLRLNYYPTCDSPASEDSATVPATGHLGISHHTDAGALTVLLQDDQCALQVLHNDRWHTVQPQADALVINLGDIAQVWSNDAYRAPLHRVLANKARDRLSAAFFFNPSYSASYAPLPSQCVERPAGYARILWRDFREQRAAGDYADQGDEVQISDYRVV